MATYTIGRVGLRLRGEYDSTVTYSKLDVVTYNGSSYVATTNSTGVLPTNTTKWQLMAQGEEASYIPGEYVTQKRWIDGKPIYRHVQTIGPKTSNGVVFDLSALNVKNLVSFTGMVYSDAGFQGYAFTLPAATNVSTYQIQFEGCGQTVYIATNYRTWESGYIVVEYTKTTD